MMAQKWWLRARTHSPHSWPRTRAVCTSNARWTRRLGLGAGSFIVKRVVLCVQARADSEYGSRACRERHRPVDSSMNELYTAVHPPSTTKSSTPGQHPFSSATNGRSPAPVVSLGASRVRYRKVCRRARSRARRPDAHDSARADQVIGRAACIDRARLSRCYGTGASLCFISTNTGEMT
jgi:hypothetical protein